MYIRTYTDYFISNKPINLHLDASTNKCRPALFHYQPETDLNLGGKSRFESNLIIELVTKANPKNPCMNELFYSLINTPTIMYIQ